MIKQEMNFERSLTRLEEIVQELETGNPELQRSMVLFEEGVALAVACREELDRCDARITVLQQQLNGELVTEDFEA
ncbi:MAG: exodeoxyribonuclease VII small subunit [Syntrophomonadaceae bacterium]|nr:exodeoxyribonuclease VII small subunit [Syntrophomonadaceae bacterium]